MRFRVRWRGGAVALAVSVGAVAVAAVSLVAAPPAYALGPPVVPGAVQFAVPSATRTCSGATPSGVSISLPYDGTQLSGALSASVWARFSSSDYTTQVTAPAVPVLIAPGSSGVITHSFAVPAAAASLRLAELWVQADNGWYFGYHSFGLQCSDPIPITPTAPVVSASMICGGDTTLTVDARNTDWGWLVNLGPRSGVTRTVANVEPHTTVSVDLGLTSDLAAGFGVLLHAGGSVGADGGIFTPQCGGTTQPTVAVGATTAPSSSRPTGSARPTAARPATTTQQHGAADPPRATATPSPVRGRTSPLRLAIATGTAAAGTKDSPTPSPSSSASTKPPAARGRHASTLGWTVLLVTVAASVLGFAGVSIYRAQRARP